MGLLNRIKSGFAKFNSHLLPIELKSEKRKKILFYFSFYLIVISTFFTIVSQFPAFTARGITQIFQVGWIICLIPLIMLDYKRVLEYLLFSLTIILPFIAYCLIALLFKVPSFSYGATTYAFLCLFLFMIFGTFSKYKNSLTTKTIAMSLLLLCLFNIGIKLKRYAIL